MLIIIVKSKGHNVQQQKDQNKTIGNHGSRKQSYAVKVTFNCEK